MDIIYAEMVIPNVADKSFRFLHIYLYVYIIIYTFQRRRRKANTAPTLSRPGPPAPVPRNEFTRYFFQKSYTTRSEFTHCRAHSPKTPRSRHANTHIGSKSLTTRTASLSVSRPLSGFIIAPTPCVLRKLHERPCSSLHSPIRFT